MKNLICAICFLFVSDVFGDTKVLDFLYEIRSNDSAASMRFKEINQNARNLDLEKALSEIEAITARPLAMSNLSMLGYEGFLCRSSRLLIYL